MKHITYAYEPDYLSLTINSGPLSESEAWDLAAKLTAILLEFPDAQVSADRSLTR